MKGSSDTPRRARRSLPARELLYLRDYLTAALPFVQKASPPSSQRKKIAKAAELPGSAEHTSSGTVLTLAGVVNSALDELTRKIWIARRS